MRIDTYAHPVNHVRPRFIQVTAKGNPMAPHDNAYKLIFSHPEMLQDLLQGFVPEEWVALLDFSTLEKINASYVSDKLHNRADDIVWRLRLADKWLYICVLLEFQSRNDRWMALRLMTYTGLLYQDLIAQGQIKRGQGLPPIFPVVIYNGESRWTAPLDIAELIDAPPGNLSAYQPRMRYFLLDEKRLADSLVADDNLMSKVIRLENSQGLLDMQATFHQLCQRLHSDDESFDSLRKAFTVWIKQIILPSLPEGESIPDTYSLEEIDSMLAERVKQWTQDLKQEGRQEGLQEGIQLGRTKGQAGLLARQIERRFGPLEMEHQQRLEQAAVGQLDAWGDAILTAQSLDELFATH
ncbi:MAG: Rpn family recombination-promoting nuclease/putative transposase [Burkholderia sp.]